MRASSKSYSSAKRMRSALSLPEVLLWQHLRGNGIHGLRFRRQHPVGPFVLDFYCAERKLGIEIDGRAHDSAEAANEDEKRTMWLNNQGIRMVRFMASDVLSNLEGVIAMIADITAPSTSFAGPPPPPRGGGYGEIEL